MPDKEEGKRTRRVFFLVKRGGRIISRGCECRSVGLRTKRGLLGKG